MKKIIAQIVLIVFAISTVHAQLNDSAAEANKMKWWKDAKFGMFIHWGIYSVLAGTYEEKKIADIGEWIMNTVKIPIDECSPKWLGLNSKDEKVILSGLWNSDHVDKNDIDENYFAKFREHVMKMDPWHTK